MKSTESTNPVYRFNERVPYTPILWTKFDPSMSEDLLPKIVALEKRFPTPDLRGGINSLFADRGKAIQPVARFYYQRHSKTSNLGTRKTYPEGSITNVQMDKLMRTHILPRDRHLLARVIVNLNRLLYGPESPSESTETDDFDEIDTI